MKTFLLTLSLIIGFSFSMPETIAQPTKKEIKAASKVSKKREKELRKEGWKIQGSSTLLGKLEKHNLRTTDYGGSATEYVGLSERNIDIDMGVTEAIANAAQYYAQNSGSVVKGRIEDQKSKLTETQQKAFIAAFEQLIVKEIKGEFQKSFVIYKENYDKKSKKNSYDVQVFYLLDEEAASQARIRTMKIAAAEAKIAQEIGDEISDYINRGFANNKVTVD